MMWYQAVLINYNKYKPHLKDDSYIKYCHYFKYWLYRERMSGFLYSSNRNHWNDCIPCVWEKLEADNNRHSRMCEFDNEEFSYSFIQVKKRLNEICSIKENSNIVEAIKKDRRKCLDFNKKLNTYLIEMLLSLTTLSSDTKHMQKYIDINEQCSVKKLKTIFDELECQPEVFNQVPQTKTCGTLQPKIKESCTLQEGDNIEELCQPLCKCKECDNPEVLCQTYCKSQKCETLMEIIKESCPHESLNSPPITQITTEKPPKSPHLQIPVTVLSSVVGTIFFFLFLYKFTPFRSWFLNRIGSKKTLKHKIKQDMEREFLEAPFQPPYRDDQNSRPRVGYSQN
ncbi:PIR protein [Plasmodium vivax]|uniref:VIR protein n=1 Tax=Plasmodium vivax TaxID=5855 RepID=A0A565A4L4_PLAVI|nr:PIR protein [Plasmodium vivax]